MHSKKNGGPPPLIFFSVIFDPEQNALANICTAKRFGYEAIVYVNRASDLFIDKLNTLDIIVLGNNENVGLGVAFSEVEDYLSDCGVEYFIYFDQDTIVADSAWKYIADSYEANFSSPEIGMLFYGSKTSKYSDLVVSSGCLYSMSIIKKIGNHNSGFFVEGVDYEFCLRLMNYKFKIQNIHLDLIDHLSLQPRRSVILFGFNVDVRIYGNRRLKDFNFSHIKLIGSSLISSQYGMTFLFLRSLVAFNFKELLSRVLSRFF